MGIKHLTQENPNMEINLIRLLSKLDPSKSNKLTPLLLKIFKERIKNWKTNYDQEGPFGRRHEYVNNILLNSSDLETTMLVWMIEHIFYVDNVEVLKEFNEVLEKGLVDENDISKYKNMDEVINQLSIAKTKELLKNARKEIKVIYEDEKVLMLKPLSFEASMKYGSGTKWCTSMKSDPEYFYRYSKNGILIYVINKESGRKFGCHSETKNPTVQIFNEVDERIDSFTMGLEYETLKKLMDFMDTRKYFPNFALFSEEELKASESCHLVKVGFNVDVEEDVPQEFLPEIEVEEQAPAIVNMVNRLRNLRSVVENINEDDLFPKSDTDTDIELELP
jgi:hypothetical protein